MLNDSLLVLVQLESCMVVRALSQTHSDAATPNNRPLSNDAAENQCAAEVKQNAVGMANPVLDGPLPDQLRNHWSASKQ